MKTTLISLAALSSVMPGVLGVALPGGAPVARQVAKNSIIWNAYLGEGCNGANSGTTTATIGVDAGAGEGLGLCATTINAQCALLADFTEGDGECVVGLFQSEDCTGDQENISGDETGVIANRLFNSFQAACE